MGTAWVVLKSTSRDKHRISFFLCPAPGKQRMHQTLMKYQRHVCWTKSMLCKCSRGLWGPSGDLVVRTFEEVGKRRTHSSRRSVFPGAGHIPSVPPWLRKTTIRYRYHRELQYLIHTNKYRPPPTRPTDTPFARFALKKGLGSATHIYPPPPNDTVDHVTCSRCQLHSQPSVWKGGSHR